MHGCPLLQQQVDEVVFGRRDTGGILAASLLSLEESDGLKSILHEFDRLDGDSVGKSLLDVKVVLLELETRNGLRLVDHFLEAGRRQTLGKAVSQLDGLDLLDSFRRLLNGRR